jgi:hypothetical protein
MSAIGNDPRTGSNSLSSADDCSIPWSETRCSRFPGLPGENCRDERPGQVADEKTASAKAVFQHHLGHRVGVHLHAEFGGVAIKRSSTSSSVLA